MEKGNKPLKKNKTIHKNSNSKRAKKNITEGVVSGKGIAFTILNAIVAVRGRSGQGQRVQAIGEPPPKHWHDVPGQETRLQQKKSEYISVAQV